MGLGGVLAPQWIPLARYCKQRHFPATVWKPSTCIPPATHLNSARTHLHGSAAPMASMLEVTATDSAWHSEGRVSWVLVGREEAVHALAPGAGWCKAAVGKLRWKSHSYALHRPPLTNDLIPTCACAQVGVHTPALSYAVAAPASLAPLSPSHPAPTRPPPARCPPCCKP